MEFLDQEIDDKDYERLGKMVAIESQVEKIGTLVNYIDLSHDANEVTKKLNDAKIIIDAVLPLIAEFDKGEANENSVYTDRN